IVSLEFRFLSLRSFRTNDKPKWKESIDQHLGFLEFENTEDEVLAAFDIRISSLCFNVNQCPEQIE
ncbi:hypothetical protein L914_11681, partial [Phytophthora nicotianae]